MIKCYSRITDFSTAQLRPIPFQENADATHRRKVGPKSVQRYVRESFEIVKSNFRSYKS